MPKLVAETVAAEESEAGNSSQQSRSPGPNPYLAGEVIGDRYRLLRELGRGGMGVVWEAHSLVLGIDVALKLIRTASAGSGVASRMEREAHAAARLGHPAIVRVFDFGWTSRGDPYLVMELVMGETLSAVLARDMRVDAIRAVQMILPVADGLRVAHDKHIVHRDIKPDNIFLATDTFGRTQPKLLDFGIAKIDLNAHDGKLTQVGAVLGSPEYMSPEQALGIEDVDERTDVWSLTVVLYELVTGTVPFTRANYNALMQAIIHDPPTPMLEHAAVDSSLWIIVERGLQKDRDQRWSNMTELGEALALWLYDHGIKEDLSGNSIRAVWLDGALSGVRAETNSTIPPRRRPTEDDSGKFVRQENGLTQQSTRHVKQSSLRRRLLLIALALGAGLTLIAGTLLYVTHRLPGDWQSSAAISITSSAPNIELASSPTALSYATDKLPEPASVATSSSSDATAASADAAEAKKVNPKRSKRSSKKTHDFGF